MTQMANMNANKFGSWFIPTSWFSRINDRLEHSVAAAFKYVIFESLRLDMQRRGKDLLTSYPARAVRDVDTTQIPAMSDETESRPVAELDESFQLSLYMQELGDYRVGDKVEEDIISTTKLSFVDVEGTQAQRDREAQRVPVILRYFPSAADEVEAQFRQAFAKTQEQFLGSVNKAFGHVPLSGGEIDSLKFESLAMLFQKQNESFPVSTNRAALWAAGDYDKGYQEFLATELRQAMAPVIHPEVIPENFRFGATVRVIPVANKNEPISEQEAVKTNHNFSRTNFASLVIVRRNFINRFSGEDRDVAKFLVNLLEPNSAIDEAITQKLRDERTADVWVVCNFEPGQVVARRGQVIDRKTMTAIEQLKDKAVVGKLQELQAKQQAAVGELQQLVAENKTNKEIGAELGVVEGTVKIHVTSIFGKLGVSDRTRALLTAIKRGIVQID